MLGGKCETCMWWSVSHGGKWGRCDRDAYGDVKFEVISDGGSYYLETEPDFGCIHHETKDEYDGRYER